MGITARSLLILTAVMMAVARAADPGPAAAAKDPAGKPGDATAWTVADWSEWSLQETAPEGVSAIVRSIGPEAPGAAKPALSPEAERAGVLVLGPGEILSIVKYTGKRPILLDNYEVCWEGMRVNGSDFFAALTFPVGSKEHCATFVAGGWGGWTIGVSCIDGLFANENETTTSMKFEQGRWYAFTLQVTRDCLRALIDGEEQFKVSLKGKTIGMHPGDIRVSTPLGFASYATKGAVRNVRFRPLKPGELTPPE